MSEKCEECGARIGDEDALPDVCNGCDEQRWERHWEREAGCD